MAHMWLVQLMSHREGYERALVPGPEMSVDAGSGLQDTGV
jgi:hypothetical protein